MLQNPLRGQITAAAEAGGSPLIRALTDVPGRKEAGGTPQLRHILFAGRGTELEAEGRWTERKEYQKKDFDMGADTDRRRRLGREKYK